MKSSADWLSNLTDEDINFAKNFILASFFAEVILSKKSNKWLGLIIPFVGFLISILLLIAYINWEPASMKIEDYNGSTLIHSFEISANILPSSTKIINCVILFVLLNIPTMIHLIIYAGFRKKMVSNAAINKMKLGDL